MTCRRNWCPRPRFSWAPSIRPGISATVVFSVILEINDADLGVACREGIGADLGMRP